MTIENTTAATTDTKETVVLNPSPYVERSAMVGLSRAKVIAIPPMPAKIPRGIPIAPITAASAYTPMRFCFAVAPTPDITPIYFRLSLIEI